MAPLPVSYAGGGADDDLFVHQADALLDGRWLGPFDDYTLVKGPFYPLFLAAAALFRLPIQVATQAAILAGGLVASCAAGRLLDRRAGTFCFAVLVLDPAPFDRMGSLLLREPLYGGEIVLVLGLAAHAFLVRTAHPLGSALLLGLAFGALWMTREEGSLLLPSLALLAAWRIGRDHLEGRRWTRIAPLILVPVASCLLPILLVSAINRLEYGVFRTTDSTAHPLMSAYGALQRIDHPWRPTIPIPRSSLLAAYTVSPAARELAPDLEGEGRRFWTIASCRDEPFPGCDDIQAGWIVWALRGAVTAAGHYHTARDADRFYRRLGREVNEACDDGRISCTGHGASLLPPFDVRYLPLVARDIWLVARDTALLGPVTPGTIPTLVPPSAFAHYARITPGTPRSLGQNLPRHRGLIAHLLATLMPLFTAIGLPISLAWTTWRITTRIGEPLTIFIASLALALIVRTAFLGFAQAALVPMQFRYLSPGFPIALLLVASCLADMTASATRVTAWRRARP